MKRAMMVSVVIAMAVLFSMATAEPKEQPAGDKAKAEKVEKAKPVKVRLWFPFSKLENLSDDQKVKMDEIHKATRAKIEEIEKQEIEQVMDLLTDEQKQQIEAAVKAHDDELAAKRKEYTDKRKVEEDAKKKAEEAPKAND